MEYLIKQSRRVKFADSVIQPDKNTSFREDDKRPRNWFGKQMNPDYDVDEVEEATAVAAAAYVVVSVTDSNIAEKSALGGDPQPSFTRVKSQKEVTKVSSGRLDANKMDQKQTSGKYSMGNSEIEEAKEPEAAVKVAGPSPSVKGTPTFADKPKVHKALSFADGKVTMGKETKPADSIKPKPDPVSGIKVPKPEIPTTPKPVPSPGQSKRQAPTVSEKGSGGTDADSWERAQLAKIKQRYEEMEARIASWENERKKKSRRRLDRTERELERKRLKALERFHSEMEDIIQIVNGARSKAKERRINEEKKAKEKATTYRKTGKPPKTCFCF